MLNEHNTVFAQSGPLYATGVSQGPPESLTQTTSRSLQLFLQISLGSPKTSSDLSSDYFSPPTSLLCSSCSLRRLCLLNVTAVNANKLCLPNIYFFFQSVAIVTPTTEGCFSIFIALIVQFLGSCFSSFCH